MNRRSREREKEKRKARKRVSDWRMAGCGKCTEQSENPLFLLFFTFFRQRGSLLALSESSFIKLYFFHEEWEGYLSLCCKLSFNWLSLKNRIFIAASWVNSKNCSRKRKVLMEGWTRESEWGFSLRIYEKNIKQKCNKKNNQPA